MVGQITYTEDQILFILRLTLEKEKRNVILQKYQERFGKPLTASQLRYVKAKYGHDAEFGSALVNGVLPKDGGNRKTAPPAPTLPMKLQTSQQVALPNRKTAPPAPTPPMKLQTGQQAALPDNNLQPYSYHVSPPSQLQQSTPRHVLSIGEICLPSTQVQQSAQSTQSPPGRALPTDKVCRPEPTPTATATTPYDQFMSMYDPNNPYGFQPVLQHYNGGYLQPVMASKRKHEESSGQGEKQLKGPDGLSAHNNRSQHASIKRVKQDLAGMPQAAGVHTTQQSSPPTPIIDPSLFGEEEVVDLTGDSSGISDSEWEQFLNELDLGSLTQNTAPMPLPIQQPQVGYINQVNNGNMNFGMTSGTSFPTPSPALFNNPLSASPNPSLTFSGTETEQSWSPFCEDPWGSSPVTFPNYALPVMTAVDSAVDSVQDPNVHGLRAVPGGGSSAGMGFNHNPSTYGDVPAVATAHVENTFSRLTPEPDWSQLLSALSENLRDNDQPAV